MPRPQAQGPTAPDPIEVSVLAPVKTEGVGLLSPEATGLPYDLWHGMSELRVRNLILKTPITGVPATRDLFSQLLLARTIAPSGSGQGDSLLIARVDRLIEKGRLQAASALIEAAGPPSSDLFERMFDIALLNDAADRACRILRKSSDLSPADQIAIFCQIVTDNWQEAEAALAQARDQKSIPAHISNLLGRFLDPEFGEGLPPPELSQSLSPLEYVLRDSFGFSLPRTSLPLAFRHIGLSGRAGLRERILAAEALTAARAIPGNLLFAAYRESRPAASGGAWERANAAQKLDARIDDEDWAAALERALEQFEPLGLMTAFAEEYRPTLTNKTGRSAGLHLIKVLSGQFDGVLPSTASKPVRLAYHLGRGERAPAPTAIFTAAFDGLAGTLPSIEPAKRMGELIEGNRIGEALLKAIGLLSVGNEIDPDDLQTALYAISQAGLHDIALKIAVQTLVLEDIL